MVKPLYLFGVEIRIQNLVGTEDYGLYFALFNFVFLYQVINDPGIQNYNSRLIAQSPDQVSYHFPRILGAKIMLAVVLILAVWSGAFLFDFTDNYKLLGLITLNLFLSTLFVFIRSNLAAIGQYRADSLISAIDKIIMLVLLGYLVWLSPYQDQFTIEWMVYGQMLSYLIACAVAGYLLWSRLTGSKVIFSTSYLMKLIRLCLPFAAIILLTALFLRMDGVMLKHMLNDNGLQAGIYAAAFRFFDAANMLAFLFPTLLLPMFSKMLKDKEDISDLLGISVRAMLVMSIIYVSAFVAYRYNIMDALYTRSDAQYGDAMYYLLLAYLATSISYIYGALMFSHNHLKAIIRIQAIGVILNLMANYVLIPRYGATGAGLATLLTQTIMTLGMMIWVYGYCSYRFDLQILIRSLIFGLLCAAVYQCLPYLGIGWIYSLVLGILVSGLLALITGMVSKSMWIELKKAKA